MSRKALVLFALLSLVWGIPYLMIKVAVAEVSVPFLVFARSALGAAVLLPLALREDRAMRILGYWRPLVAFAALEMIIPWGLLSHGEIRLTSSTAGLLIAATPTLTVLLSRLLGERERLGSRRSSGLAAGFAGVFVLAAPELGGDLWSIVEVLLAAACYAAGSIVAARWLKAAPTLALSTCCLTFAALVYLPPALATWPDAVPSAPAIAAIAGLAVFCTALAFVWFFALIREVGAERTVVITYVAPAIAVAAGVGLLSEPLNLRILASFALILCGSYLATGRTAIQSGEVLERS